MKILRNTAILATLTLVTFNSNNNNAVAVSIEDIPLPPEDIPSWVKPDLIAFAEYDYRLTEGREGEYTTLIKGPESLFDETQSGIFELEGDWSYIAGVGWTTEGSSVTYRWKNERVPTNTKFFSQSVLFLGGQITGVDVTTDDPNDNIDDFRWIVQQDRLIINGTIKPQPNDVFITVSFREPDENPDNLLNTFDVSPIETPIILQQASILDQCEQIPEPTSTLSLLSLGILGAGATLKRKVKRSHSLKK